MIDEIAMQQLVKFISGSTEGVEFDKLDNEFQLLMNSELNIRSEDDFDKMFVGQNASVKQLCYKRNGRYFINAE